MTSFTIVFIVLTVALISHAQAVAEDAYLGHSVLLSKAVDETGAKCLDGSPGRYYFAPATTISSSTKYLMFLEGGGWCSGIYTPYMTGGNSCTQRINTEFGTTKNDPTTQNFNKIGMLGNNVTLYPLTYDWNKIYLRYCDGGSYSGNLETPINYSSNNGTNGTLYFRGKRILDAVFEDLILNKSLSNATDFILAGGSAGGLGVWLHANYIYEKYFVKKTGDNHNTNNDNNNNNNNNNNGTVASVKFVAMPDVGFFLEYNGYNETYYTNFSNGLKWVYNAMNISQGSSIISPSCYNKYSKINQEWQCIFPQNIANEMEMDTFVLNSQYDSYQAENILGTGTNSTVLLNEYGKNFTNLLKQRFLSFNGKNRGNNGQLLKYGAYVDGCYHHGAGEPIWWHGLHIDNLTQAQAFSIFYQSNSTQGLFWFQNVSYPCTQCCPQ